jgi:hypothetical protein
MVRVSASRLVIGIGGSVRGSGREESADGAGGAVDARGVDIEMGDESQPS